MLQVVHHLFPNICHTHYPAIAPIVVDTCREFGIPYKVFPTVRPCPCPYLAIWPTASAHAFSVVPGRHGLAAVLVLSQCLRNIQDRCPVCNAGLPSCHPVCYHEHSKEGTVTDFLFGLQFLSAMSAHFQHLKAMGAPTLIPSFSSLG